MIIYIVLGIAADDIFVFYDAYQQSAEMDKKVMDSKNKRLAYAFRRAARAMAITSSTTAVSFFANAISSIASISAFGIFAGIIVPVNYLLVIMIFPPAVIWYEEKILAKKEDGSWKCPGCICFARCKKEDADYDKDGNKLAKLGKIERFFDTKINNCLSNVIVRIVIMVLALGWAIAAIIMTSQVKPLTKQPDFIEKDHPYMQTFELIQEKFLDKESGSGPKSDVGLMWGPSGLDKSEIPAWNQTFKGNATWDEEFSKNFHKPENQDYMFKKCIELKDVKGVSSRVDGTDRDVTVNCWTDRFVTDFLYPKNKQKVDQII